MTGAAVAFTGQVLGFFVFFFKQSQPGQFPSYLDGFRLWVFKQSSCACWRARKCLAGKGSAGQSEPVHLAFGVNMNHGTEV